MKKINNPYTGSEGYNCFGCSPENVDGLQMNFIEEGEFVISEWEPKLNFSGYTNVLHGGIQASLMDEIAIWCIQVKLKTAGVTTHLNTKFRKPVLMNKGNITLKSRIIKSNSRIAQIEVKLFDSDGELCSQGEVSYYILPEKIAHEKLNYPGYAAFFAAE